MANLTLNSTPEAIFESTLGTVTLSLTSQDMIIQESFGMLVAKNSPVNAYPGGDLIGTYDHSDPDEGIELDTNGNLTNFGVVGAIEWVPTFNPINAPQLDFSTHSLKVTKDGSETKVYKVANL